MKQRLFLLNLFLYTGLYAQINTTTDTFSIKTVEITSKRENIFSTGSKVWESDSITKANYKVANLAELVNDNSASFIKTYGSGGIATISMRGMEARHTSVLWNGFNINSPTLGLCDLSLVPVNFVDKITIITGSESALVGTSAIGGIIDLQNLPDFFDGIKIKYNSGFGSFGLYENSLNVKAGIKQFASTTNLFYEKSNNDFSYIDYNNEARRQAHAKMKNIGLLQNFYYKLNNNSILSTGIWYQVTNKEIPPLLTVAKSTAEQKDSILRIFSEYKKNFQTSNFSIRLAYFNEYELYADSFYKIYAPYKVISYKAESEERISIGNNMLFNLGISFNHYKADVNEYTDIIHKNYYAAFCGLKYDFKNNMYASLNIRKEFIENKTSPFSPSVGIEKTLFKDFITLKIKAGKNFNLPSLNDMYWVPGGNKELKPETGWSYEAGTTIFPSRQKSFALELVYFSSLINDWIQWQPTPMGFYAPQNLKQVHARGIEFTSKYYLKIKNSAALFTANYTFVKSTNLKTSQVLGTEIIGKQLIYVPEHAANISLNYNYKYFSMHYSHQFIGSRFTTLDNLDFLPYYQLANLKVEKNFIYKKNNYLLYLKINNLFNAAYQAIAYYVMPGRNYLIGININLNLIKKKNEKI